MAAIPLTVVNGATATFECSFGRGCDGLCCANGRPSVTEGEKKLIDVHLAKFLPHMRPEAVKMVNKDGWLSKRTKVGLPMARVSAGWCVFFNKGCVLHKVGAAEGDFAKYKPIQCSMFPLEPNGDGSWYVRQWGHEGETWDLFCLNPKNTKKKAVDTMAPELVVAAELGPTFNWGEPPIRKARPTKSTQKRTSAT